MVKSRSWFKFTDYLEPSKIGLLSIVPGFWIKGSCRSWGTFPYKILDRSPQLRQLPLVYLRQCDVIGTILKFSQKIYFLEALFEQFPPSNKFFGHSKLICFLMMCYMRFFYEVWRKWSFWAAGAKLTIISSMVIEYYWNELFCLLQAIRLSSTSCVIRYNTWCRW